MSYQYSELVSNRLVFFKIWGEFTADELVSVNRDVTNYLDRSDRMVHFITDFRLMMLYPMNLRKLSSTFTLFAHPNMGWGVIISEDKLVKFFSMAVAQMLIRGQNRKAWLKVVNTPKAALQILANIAPELGELKAFP